MTTTPLALRRLKMASLHEAWELPNTVGPKGFLHVPFGEWLPTRAIGRSRFAGWSNRSVHGGQSIDCLLSAQHGHWWSVLPQRYGMVGETSNGQSTAVPQWWTSRVAQAPPARRGCGISPIPDTPD